MNDSYNDYFIREYGMSFEEYADIANSEKMIQMEQFKASKRNLTNKKKVRTLNLLKNRKKNTL